MGSGGEFVRCSKEGSASLNNSNAMKADHAALAMSSTGVVATASTHRRVPMHAGGCANVHPLHGPELRALRPLLRRFSPLKCRWQLKHSGVLPSFSNVSRTIRPSGNSKAS